MKFQIHTNPDKHDEFVKKNSQGVLLQSSSWAKVKDNWKSEIVSVLDDNGEIEASALVLIKKLPAGYTMLYMPRGPVLDYGNPYLLAFFFDELRKWAKIKKALFIKFDPNLVYESSKFGDEAVINEKTKAAFSAIQAIGAEHFGFNLAMGDTIQPRFQVEVCKNGFNEESLSKKTRQMLRTARNKGVKVFSGGIELVPEFERLMQLTEARKDVKLRTGEQGSYYKKLLQIYPNDAFIMLAELDLRALYEATKQRFDENEAAFKQLKDNQEKKRRGLEELRLSLTREVQELSEKVEMLGEKVIIAGTLTIIFGKTSEILYAGMDDSYKRYMPAYITWFETLQECFNRGALNSNMGGIEGSLDDGLAKFKRNFNPEVQRLIGEFTIRTSSLAGLGLWAYNKKKSSI
jgi:serine/alanine adding enzyme